MPILNYTTTIPPERTIGQIHGILVGHGARSIMTDYNEQGTPIALKFLIDRPSGQLPIRLPANIDAVASILERDYQSKSKHRIYLNRDERAKRFREQAQKVAWRIIKDWVEAQMAILDSEMVNIEEIFLPYMIGKNGQNMFKTLSQNNFYQLTEGQKD